MPNLITHYFFAEEVLNKLPETTRKLIERNRNAYNLGSIGPDFLYTLREIGDVSARYSNRMHFNHVYETFEKSVIHLNRTRNETQTAYMLGLMTHYVADHTLHPLVYFLAEEGLTRDYPAEYQMNIHNIIESALDEWVLKERNGLDPRGFSSLYIGEGPHKVKKEIGALYREVINKVYRYDVPVIKIEFSFIISNFFGILWKDKYGIKKKFFNRVEDAFDLKKSVSSLLRPPVGYGKIDLFNEDRRYFNIVRNEESLTNKNMIELYEIALEKSVDYIADFMHAIETRGLLDRADFSINYEGIRTY